jgi:hypothetical protein
VYYEKNEVESCCLLFSVVLYYLQRSVFVVLFHETLFQSACANTPGANRPCLHIVLPVAEKYI